MSAAAINTAPTPAAGSTAAAGSATGAGTVKGAAAAHVTGMPAIFEAMLATLVQAEDAATAGAASAQVATGGKLVAGDSKATSGDGKTKDKTAEAKDGQTTTATATAATAPDATVALIVPAVTAATPQTAPATPTGGGAAADQIKASGGKAPAFAVATTLASGADANAGRAKTTAAGASGAAVNAAAPAKADAGLAPPQPAVQATAPSAPATPPPADASAASAQIPAPTADAAAATAAQAAALAGVQAKDLAAAKTVQAPPAPVPVDAKGAIAKTARNEVIKPQSSPSDATALFANTAGKNADALAPVVGPGGKAGSPDKDAQAAAATEAEAPAASQPPADPSTSATTTPATMMAAAAVAVRGSPQTVANLAAQIVKKLDARSTQFDVQLDPAGLGKVDVRVQIGADGKMSAAMSFDTPQAAAELRARSNELQQALAQSGFDVSGGMSFDVSTDRGQNGQAQNQQPEAGAAFRGKAFQAALDTTADAPPASHLSLRRTSASGVDVRI